MEILYQDAKIVVCVKPVGLDAEKALPEALKTTLGGEIYPIHRLDQNVGGVMVYARKKESAAVLSGAVQNGRMVKEYLARVQGNLPEEGLWTDFLFKDSRKNKVFVVKRQRAGVKEAKLAFCRLQGGEESLAHIRLYTGRSHQIRVQFSSRGFPLLGDHKYGARDALRAPQLFSCRISFPYDGKVRVFEALPDWEICKTLTLPPFPGN